MAPVRSNPLWLEQRKNRKQDCNLEAFHNKFRFNSILACGSRFPLLEHSCLCVGKHWPEGLGPLTHVGEASFLRDLFDSRSRLSGAGDRLQADLRHRVVSKGRKQFPFCFCLTVKQSRQRQGYPYWTMPIMGPVAPTLMA